MASRNLFDEVRERVPVGEGSCSRFGSLRRSCRRPGRCVAVMLISRPFVDILTEST
jgi:hypothetical protein